MLAKILVGVVAAIAVTGVGVYYAMPDSHCCGARNTAATGTPADTATECPGDGETPSCCAAKMAVPTVSEGEGCCAAKAKTSADSLGACVGGMALTNAPVAVKKPALHCCDE